jgi:cephalosporin hydroxylase
MDRTDLEHRLVALEARFGGYHTKVPWNVRSQYAPEPRLDWMTGGDRMSVHGYAPVYAEVLSSITPRVIVELGILRGTGLAMWCDLFPTARVIGLDIDLQHFAQNFDNLRERGAFEKNRPDLFQFDEMAPDAPARLAAIMGGAKADLFIDDALHSDEAILRTFSHAWQHVRRGGAYIIEDNRTVAEKLPVPHVSSHDLLTVVRRHDD